jgi:hypothetical protein
MSDLQRHNEVLAARDNTMRADFNHGRPPVAATPRPGVFYGHGVVAARAGGERPAGAAHGMLGEHGAIAARPPVAMNSSGAPRAMNQPFRPETPAARGAPGGAVHAPAPAAGRAHQSFPGGAPVQASPGMARPQYPGNPRAPSGAAAPRGGGFPAAPRGMEGGPRGEPGNAHAAQQGHGGERADRGAEHGRR